MAQGITPSAGGVAFIELGDVLMAREAARCLDGFPWSKQRILQVSDLTGTIIYH